MVQQFVVIYLEKGEKMSVTIGISIYNDEKNIGPLLHSLYKQNLNIEKTIIVNDGSTDKSLENIIALDEKIKKHLNLELINLNENKGFSNALNIIFKKSNSDYLIIIASDLLLPDKNILKKIMKHFYDCNDIGFVSIWYDLKLYSKFDLVGRAYKFSSFLLKKIKKTGKDIFGTGAIWALPKKVYKQLNLPINLYRIDAYIYLYVISINKKFILAPEAQVIIQMPKETFKRFIYRQVRSRSIPKEHIKTFGYLAKKELENPNLDVLIKCFIECFIQHPFDGICWVLLKTISYIYIKIFNLHPKANWRMYEFGNKNLNE